MTTYFAQVLAIEDAALEQVTDWVGMERWRRRVAREVMDPDSPYALALRQTTAVDAGRAFLIAWRELLTWAVERVLRSEVPQQCRTVVARSGYDGVSDAEGLAILVLAALQGGWTLSRMAEDPAPLDAALDIALAPLMAHSPGTDPYRPGTTGQ